MFENRNINKLYIQKSIIIKPEIKDKLIFAWPLVVLSLLIGVYFFTQELIFSRIKVVEKDSSLKIGTVSFEESKMIWEKNDFPVYSFICDADYSLLLVK